MGLKYIKEGILLKKECFIYDTLCHKGFQVWTASINGKEVLHRENGPAKVLYMNNNLIFEQYYINGLWHREDGPAYIEYYSNKIIKYEGYYIRNKIHRENGPAYINYYPSGEPFNKGYCINGKYFNSSNFEEELQKYKLEQIWG